MKNDRSTTEKPNSGDTHRATSGWLRTLAIEFGIAVFAATVIFFTITLSQKNIEFVYQGF